MMPDAQVITVFRNTRNTNDSLTGEDSIYPRAGITDLIYSERLVYGQINLTVLLKQVNIVALEISQIWRLIFVNYRNRCDSEDIYITLNGGII